MDLKTILFFLYFYYGEKCIIDIPRERRVHYNILVLCIYYSLTARRPTTTYAFLII